MGILTRYLEKKRENKVKNYIRGSILDIGCGPAKAMTYSKVLKYVGIEFSKDDVSKLKKKYPKALFYSKNMEFEEINLKEKVDVVIMCAFIEHLDNIKNPLIQAIKNLKEGGEIVLTTPTKFGNNVHFIGASLGIFSKEAREDHKTILSKKDFVELAKKYNLKLSKFEYFEFFCNQLVVFEK